MKPTPQEAVRPERDDDLAFIQPKLVGRTLAGRVLQLSPITVGELSKLLAAVEPMLTEAAALLRQGGLRERLQAGTPDPDDWVDLAALIANHGEGLLEAMAIMARVETAWVQGLSIDRAVTLLMDLLQVNLDFFARAVPVVQSYLLRAEPPPAVAEGQPASA